MSLYIFLYIFIASLLFYSGFVYYKVYKSVSAQFLFLSLAIFSLWFILYLISFTTTYNPEVLIYFSRGMFSLSILGLYYFIVFLYYTNKKLISTQRYRLNYYSLIISLIFLLIGVSSPLVISEMTYSIESKLYYESYGSFYYVYVLLYLLFFPIYIYLSYDSILNTRKIDKNRMLNICIGFGLFVFSGVLLQVILPLLGVFIFEREIILIIIPFLFCFWSAHNRYAFSDLSVSIGKILVFTFSILFSYIIVYLFHSYIQNLPSLYQNFWDISAGTLILELCFAIVIHNIVYKSLVFYILPHTKSTTIIKGLHDLREKIPRITNFDQLNTFLKSYFQQKFHISYINIVSQEKHFSSELSYYFNNGISRKMFINDVFFIENNKFKFKDINRLRDIPKEIFIVLPVYNDSGKLIMLLEVGQKPLGGIYKREEIFGLRSFATFLQGHLQYLGIYKEIQELSINLDKKVDEKTIEFNNLLNKQKEFIAYVGHEIKNPITNTLFLTDSIKHDTYGKVDSEIQEDISILYDELVKVSKLVKYIFSAEKFDLDKVTLYKKPLNLSNFILDEIKYCKFNLKKESILSDIEKSVICEIDEIQFRQVIQNLINNSIKFSSSENTRIFISLKTIKSKAIIKIEDNGSGFSISESNNIFEKYKTGLGSEIGLGMGLYLCKKIIKLHNGSIEVSNSKMLGGAKFTIIL